MEWDRHDCGKVTNKLLRGVVERVVEGLGAREYVTMRDKVTSWWRAVYGMR